MSDKPRRKKTRKRPTGSAGPPTPLGRAPRTDLRARADDLDPLLFDAAGAVAARLTAEIDASLSLDHMKLLMTEAQMVLAMKSTHQSIRMLAGLGEDQADCTVDALALTRVQLERCFLMLLMADNPKRWHVRFRKNAWRAFAQKFFRDQRIVGRFEPFGEYFGPSGSGVGMLRAFAREMNVWEDELQTLRTDVLGGDVDPRWDRRQIRDMPSPAQTIGKLSDETWRELGRLIYPHYDNLSHYSHGGLVGVMSAAILRPGFDAGQGGELDKAAFWRRHVGEMSLPYSYVAVLFVATLAARKYLPDQADLAAKLAEAWCPYHSDGSPLGVAVWDAWVARALGRESAPEKRKD